MLAERVHYAIAVSLVEKIDRNAGAAVPREQVMIVDADVFEDEIEAKHRVGTDHDVQP
ncbi:MAG TPA: hypothetical protein VM282_04025 [Acidimicrobiales bacterium]|nr:hypothetical protein [Acidimicrobiales bacterium]